MRGSWRCAALLALLDLSGCGIRIPVQPPVWAVDPGPPESHDPALTALADAIDPGPQAPLRAAMPAPLLADVDVTAAGEDPRVAAEHDLRAALLLWGERGADAAGDDAVLALLARAVARAEALADAGRIHPELLATLIKAYAALDERAPQVQRLFTARPPEDAARRLLLRTAATLLRRHADHPDTPEVLTAVADAAARAQDFTRAAAVRRLLGERQVGRVGPELQLALADACYRALEPGCGDAALARARGAAGPELQDGLAATAWLGEQAHAARTRGGDGLEDRLERAPLLRALGRTRDAAATYRAAAAAAPDDARPRVGLAGLALLRGDPDAALAELTAARGLRNQDRIYHELTIALLWPRLAATGATRARARQDLQAAAAGYRRFEAARAGALALLLAATEDDHDGDAGDADGTAALRGLARVQPQVAALVREFPDSPDVRRLAYLAAQVAPTADAALAAVRPALPPALARDAGLQALRLETWFHLAARWDRRAELAGLSDAIAARPGRHDDLRATALAAQATLAGEPAPAVARQIFTRMTEDGAPHDRARALSNLAVLQTASGDPEGAIDQWTAALAFDHAVHFIRLNIAGALVRHESPPRAELGPLLATLAADAETVELELLALAWRCVLASHTASDDRSERAALALALRAWRTADPGAAVPGRWGVLSGPPRVQLGYSDERLRGRDTGGLTLTAEVDRDYWLIVPPPDLDALFTEPARRPRPG